MFTLKHRWGKEAREQVDSSLKWEHRFFWEHQNKCSCFLFVLFVVVLFLWPSDLKLNYANVPDSKKPAQESPCCTNIVWDGTDLQMKLQHGHFVRLSTVQVLLPPETLTAHLFNCTLIFWAGHEHLSFHQFCWVLVDVKDCEVKDRHFCVTNW